MRIFFPVFLGAVALLGDTNVASAQAYAPLNCTVPAAPTVDSVSYTIPGLANGRRIDIAISEPSGLPAGVTLPLPTVIWSHGGAKGGNPGNLEDWRNATTEACYVSVTIGHAWPRNSLGNDICDTIFDITDPAICGRKDATIKMLSYLRPHDISEVIKHLETAYPAIVDPEKIVVAGHSGGAGGAMMVAGATRAFRTGNLADRHIEIMDLSDPKPIAFVALSPQGPGVDGFYEGWKGGGETSWDTIDRPIYVGTGAGDNGCNQSPRSETSSTIHFCSNLGPVPSNRKAVFDFLPPSATGDDNKYRYFIEDWRAAHTIFKLSDNTCVAGGGQTPDAQCDVMFDGLKQTVYAFLDWHVRGDPLAQTLLTGAAGIPGPAGLVSWDSK